MASRLRGASSPVTPEEEFPPPGVSEGKYFSMASVIPPTITPVAILPTVPDLDPNYKPRAIFAPAEIVGLLLIKGIGRVLMNLLTTKPPATSKAGWKFLRLSFFMFNAFIDDLFDLRRRRPIPRTADLRLHDLHAMLPLHMA